MYTDESLIAFCQRALQTPSFSGRERQMAELMKDKMLELGFDEAVFDRLGNVIGTIHGKRPGKTILMDGHIDTVDVIDEAQWTHGPFSGEIADGKIYGRGASDMKGSDCAMVMAAGRFAAQTKKNFAGTICVSGTVHEECFEGVAPREVTKRVKPDFVIVGEATSTSIKIGQRGRAEVVVETEGVSCHSSNPEKGVNAVYAMTAVVDEIRKIVPNEHPLLGKGILELTDIISAPYPGASVVPAKCRATFDRRTLVGEDEAVILGQVEEAIARAQEKHPGLKAHCYLAESEHPFTTEFWRGDVRITTHYMPRDIFSNLYSVAHEGGHALYELNINPDYDYTVVTHGATMGIHESQSRLFENLVGRSRAFVHYLYPTLKELFPAQLADVSAEEIWRAVNRAEPGLIRTEADELTYALHIMVRYELEKALMQGTLAVADLPAAWNAKYKEYLGVDVPDDAHGCLQDIHWSMGDIGYFPSYALGSAYGAQALDDLRKTNDFDAQWANGDVEPLKAALKERVWQWGSMKEPAWLVESLCGGKFDPHHFTDYLKKKYTELYEL